MRVLIVGGGGREHSLAIGLSGSPSVDSIHTAPGNAGTGKLGVNHDIGSSDIEGLVGLAREIEADLVVVGPEAPLVLGLADKLREIGIPCFGPIQKGPCWRDQNCMQRIRCLIWASPQVGAR